MPTKAPSRRLHSTAPTSRSTPRACLEWRGSPSEGLPYDEPGLFQRHPANPILTAADWPTAINVVFNPAAIQLATETVLFVRVEARTGISHIAVARSDDGVGDWQIDPEPLLMPADNDGERWGFEDPRAVWVEELGTHVISCTAYGPAGPAVFLATSVDFKFVERLGIVVAPTVRRSCRPNRRRMVPVSPPGLDRLSTPESRSPLWASAAEHTRGSDDAAHRRLVGCAADRDRRSAPPNGAGWLLVYHGVKETVGGAIYRVGLALLDSKSRLASSDERTIGCLHRRRRTSARATSRTPSSRAG